MHTVSSGVSQNLPVFLILPEQHLSAPAGIFLQSPPPQPPHSLGQQTVFFLSVNPPSHTGRASDWPHVGAAVGIADVGSAVGSFVGVGVGSAVGSDEVGVAVGEVVVVVGDGVGVEVGASVRQPHPRTPTAPSSSKGIPPWQACLADTPVSIFNLEHLSPIFAAMLTTHSQFRAGLLSVKNVSSYPHVGAELISAQAANAANSQEGRSQASEGAPALSMAHAPDSTKVSTQFSGQGWGLGQNRKRLATVSSGRDMLLTRHSSCVEGTILGSTVFLGFSMYRRMAFVQAHISVVETSMFRNTLANTDSQRPFAGVSEIA
jgi:hypothetical protein